MTKLVVFVVIWFDYIIVTDSKVVWDWVWAPTNTFDAFSIYLVCVITSWSSSWCFHVMRNTVWGLSSTGLGQGCFLAFFLKTQGPKFQNSSHILAKTQGFFLKNSWIFFCKTQFFGKSKLHQLLQVWQSWLLFCIIEDEIIFTM